MKKVRKAVIPAAGLGTRFLPATKGQPKEMLPIVDKPTIQYIVEEAVASGIEEILIVTGRNKKAIEDHFDKNPELEAHLQQKGQQELLAMVEQITDLANIHFIRQKEAKGLGHAIYCAKAFVGDEPFAVLLGDDVVASHKPCLAQLIEVYAEKQAAVVGVQPIAWDQVNKYGIVAGEEEDEGLYRVGSLVEKPPIGQAPSNIAVLGRYIVPPQIFDILANTPKGSGGEIQFTDGLDRLAAKQTVYAYCFQGKRYDVGDKLGFLQATTEFALAREDLGEVYLNYLRELLNQQG